MRPALQQIDRWGLGQSFLAFAGVGLLLRASQPSSRALGVYDVPNCI